MRNYKFEFTNVVNFSIAKRVNREDIFPPDRKTCPMNEADNDCNI